MAPTFLDKAFDKPRPNQGYRSQANLILLTVPLKGPKLEIFGSRVFHKSDLYVLVIQELGEKIQNFDGFG
jgi:hypothetical protein